MHVPGHSQNTFLDRTAPQGNRPSFDQEASRVACPAAKYERRKKRENSRRSINSTMDSELSINFRTEKQS
jgi:hypothetical protein